MNVASLGNMVRQLHVHIIARHEGDAAWPGPVWGIGEMVAYDEENAGQRIKLIQSELNR
jgi:diadenosine tetraphosphate (Ap4A) HIT family hydrolase